AAAPRAISGLIHNYVWGWATEWVFFLIEIAGIFVYYYTFDKVDRKTHLKIGWIFAISSWATMVVIVGILTFMLTPGPWLVTGGFFDGFFNESYWPQLFLRTTGMFAIAGSYAVAVACRCEDEKTRAEVIRLASAAGLVGLGLAAACFFWYRAALPDTARATFDVLLTPGLKRGMAVPVVLMAAYFARLWLRPMAARPWPALLAIGVLFASIFSFERARELIRKPYLMPGYMYSNQIIGGELPAKKVGSETASMNERGILHFAPFVPDGLRDVTDANRLEAGRMVALIECSACHTLSKSGMRPLPQKVGALGFTDDDSLSDFIDSLGSYPYMPPFVGSDAEKKALAAYLLSLTK
ncbi:MAG: hypothetical protein A2506_02180, partial [Elusimicrobia bacterium RIFOXYD12_FULL_66_9]